MHPEDAAGMRAGAPPARLLAANPEDAEGMRAPGGEGDGHLAPTPVAVSARIRRASFAVLQTPRTTPRRKPHGAAR